MNNMKIGFGPPPPPNTITPPPPTPEKKNSGTAHKSFNLSSYGYNYLKRQRSTHKNSHANAFTRASDVANGPFIRHKTHARIQKIFPPGGGGAYLRYFDFVILIIFHFSGGGGSGPTYPTLFISAHET